MFKYFVIEGIDFTGKSTQTNLLKKDLENNTLFTFIKEPSDEVKNIILNNNMDEISKYLFFSADRSRILNNLNIPSKNNRMDNRIVISERSYLSGIAYSELSDKIKNDINNNISDLIMPDKVVILKISPDVLRKRMRDRMKENTIDNIEKMGVNKLLRVQTRLMEYCFSEGLDVLTLNANRDPLYLNKEIKAFFNISDISIKQKFTKYTKYTKFTKR